MGEVIVIVSGKGGVGKTTVAANVGAALAKKENKVLVVDADAGLRNLDIAFGTESRVVYDIADVLDGVCDIEDAVLPIDGNDGLFFISSPQTRSGASVTPERFGSFCSEMAEKYDYVLVDGPAGIGDGFLRAISSAKRAVVVTQGFMAAVRDADRTISLLENKGITDISVVINSMRLDMTEKEVMLNADYILDVLGTKLLGIIPQDDVVFEAASKGKLAVDEKNCFAKTAFLNIAERIFGNEVPIMDFIEKKKKKRWFSFKRK